MRQNSEYIFFLFSVYHNRLNEEKYLTSTFMGEMQLLNHKRRVICTNISFTLHLLSKISYQRRDSFHSPNIRLIVEEVFIPGT